MKESWKKLQNVIFHWSIFIFYRDLIGVCTWIVQLVRIFHSFTPPFHSLTPFYSSHCGLNNKTGRNPVRNNSIHNNTHGMPINEALKDTYEALKDTYFSKRYLWGLILSTKSVFRTHSKGMKRSCIFFLKYRSGCVTSYLQAHNVRCIETR